jgi:hypothetical protein
MCDHRASQAFEKSLSLRIMEMKSKIREGEDVVYVLTHFLYRMYRSLFSFAVMVITQLVSRIRTTLLVSQKRLNPLPKRQKRTMITMVMRMMPAMKMRKKPSRTVLVCVVFCVLLLLVDCVYVCPQLVFASFICPQVFSFYKYKSVLFLFVVFYVVLMDCGMFPFN